MKAHDKAGKPQRAREFNQPSLDIGDANWRIDKDSDPDKDPDPKKQ
jgi:hypothetical protein